MADDLGGGDASQPPAIVQRRAAVMPNKKAGGVQIAGAGRIDDRAATGAAGISIVSAPATITEPSAPT